MIQWLVLLSMTLSSQSFATPLSSATQQKLIDLRTAIKTWAPICNGQMALSKDCYQFDMIEFAGYLCATGVQERCDDIRKSQDPVTGQWWRAPILIGQTTSNSFSRDMFMGLMFYFATTRDTTALSKWMAYIESHDHKMCTDAQDNRCKLQIGSWGMLGHLHQYLGLPLTAKMRLGMAELPTETLISAATAPTGFQLMLVGDTLFFLSLIGYHRKWMDEAIQSMIERQPEHPMFQYLAQGSTEEIAQDILNSCPATASEQVSDFFWQREIGRDENGNLMVIRTDTGTKVETPIHTMADGHDCIAALNFLIDQPF